MYSSTGIICSGLALLLSAISARGQYNYQTIDVPGALITEPYGISGSNIVGTYFDSLDSPVEMFLFNGSAYTPLTIPGLTGFTIGGIHGNDLVGSYGTSSGTSGFVYDGTNLTTINFPGTYATYVYGISGSNVVGNFFNETNSTYQGFVYNGSSYKILNVPGSSTTSAADIDGTNIVGDYTTNGIYLGYLYNGSSYTTLSIAGAVDTYASGISGTNIVGSYDNGSAGNFQGQSYLYNGTTYTIISFPGASDTIADGIDGGNITGVYSLPVNGGWNQGFLATPMVPTLNISVLNQALVFSWPTNFANFALYQTTTLSGADWTKITNTSMLINGQNQVIISGPLSQTGFYRLESQ